MAKQLPILLESWASNLSASPNTSPILNLCSICRPVNTICDQVVLLSRCLMHAIRYLTQTKCVQVAFALHAPMATNLARASSQPLLASRYSLYPIISANLDYTKSTITWSSNSPLIPRLCHHPKMTAYSARSLFHLLSFLPCWPKLQKPMTGFLTNTQRLF